MIAAIKIQNQLDCNIICQKIHEAIISYQKNTDSDLTDAIITIDIKKPTNDNNLIHKIEYKNI